MSMEEEIRQLVLSMDGVATVYAADPLWLTTVKRLGLLLEQGTEELAHFVVCSGGIEEFPLVDTTATGDGTGALTIRTRIGTDGSLPAPATARAVADAIRVFATENYPFLSVKAIVEVSTIGV
ncbi:hypothetical protein [Arthrobacter psychrochitiniphilus]|nr:hypothetical protein [Arthrobacter psychrochitiniphilus]NYG15817.1 hypothetical protein [Arthrobacter psychrochitiniphilus]